MPKATKESQLADRIHDFLDTLDFDYAHFAYRFSRFGSAIQANAFEMVLHLMHQWAMTSPHPEDFRLVRVQELSQRMLNAMTSNRK